MFGSEVILNKTNPSLTVFQTLFCDVLISQSSTGKAEKNKEEDPDDLQYLL